MTSRTVYVMSRDHVMAPRLSTATCRVAVLGWCLVILRALQLTVVLMTGTVNDVVAVVQTDPVVIS